MTGRGLVLLLLVSGLLVVCDLQSDGITHRFRYVGLLRNWTEAQSYCREKFSDLATIQNKANFTEAQEATGSSKFWIGLFKGPWHLYKKNFTSASSSKWNSSEPQSGRCPAIGGDGRLYSRDCTTIYPFFCESAQYPGTHYLFVLSSNTWSKAQKYCRTHYKDLSNITSQSQHKDFTARIQSYSYTWIGADSEFFRWSDGSSSSYSQLDTASPEAGADCVMMDSSSGSWSWRPCHEKHFFLCRADIQPPRWKVSTVKVRVRGGSADLNDLAVQEAIIQQLRQRMEERGITEEVKLRWKTQPDGKVFHREGETAPPGVCREEDVCVTL